MRQQLDLRIMNNMQWGPFRNMKDALKREVIIAGNISRKRVLLESPFGRHEWYLRDSCWAQLEHRAIPYDPPEKLHCFPSPDVVHSLRATGWIKPQYYIMSHHVDYDAYWRHVSHGALMSDITRYGNIDILNLGSLTAGETQIPPPQLGDYPGWIMEFGLPHGTTWYPIPSIATTSTVDVLTGYDFFVMTEDLRRAEGRLFQLNDYLDGEGIIVDWEDDEGEARTSQVGTSWGRGSRERHSRGRTSKGGAAPPR
ncbi:hypothetical protein GIB67_034175 [Kingdonia uniflora]|uniref:Uncharacterized protein n=1 Tax=Kingdonia uniflora TaxID=39325 RepID=A0A7J7NRQ8_9MAGN|nr:hypothetical protein GIB67_034175 [Kingdonia uniflora]